MPQGSASVQLTKGGGREYWVKYRGHGWQKEHHRTLGFASLCGATPDNEENYLLETVHRARCHLDRESGAYLTLFDRPRSGH